MKTSLKHINYFLVVLIFSSLLIGAFAAGDSSRLVNAVPNTKIITSGGQISIDVSWQSSGQAVNFDVGVSCTSPFYSIDSQKEVTVGSNPTGTTTLLVQGVCSTEVASSCIVTVKPIAGLFGDGTAMTTTVEGLICKPEQTCPANRSFCNGNNSTTCNSTGTGYGSVIDCSLTNNVCQDGYCVKEGGCSFGQEYFKGNCVSNCFIGTTRNYGNGSCDLVPADSLLFIAFVLGFIVLCIIYVSIKIMKRLRKN
ncbi:MAG: hypothetical protein NTY48_04550 [Candidatus Diapherotrites archaeon]|nr:hypothetical protein [Candidatus Diapherotrites archaeon]